ncbi:deleted in malignant brain tumors 1 protein-like [Ornithorhynchus anatinus]|uniref:deleted in malignant brain tumors 1 protein-like n=1 Tax=Ornithorhynchus anatinus TaxID=9258 RepID=UPI0019D4E6CC|nr:deleted in malignant brain tumors 1 protein-like [Ornithorhynchus anatinus]
MLTSDVKDVNHQMWRAQKKGNLLVSFCFSGISTHTEVSPVTTHSKTSGSFTLNVAADSDLPKGNAQLSCLPTGIRAIIDRGYLRKLGYSSWNVHLNDASCRPKVTKNYVVFNIPYGHCGTVKQERKGLTSYSNSIKNRIQPSQMILRQKVPQLHLTCHVDQTSVMEAALQVDGRGRNQQIGPTDYDVSISFFESPAFWGPGSQTHYYAGRRKDVFLQATLHTPDPNLVISVDTCLVSPDATDFTTVKYYLIQEGCIKDHTYTNFNSRLKNIALFKFNTFNFLNNYDVVYLQCKIVVCRAGDYFSRCYKGCVGHRKEETSSKKEKDFKIVGPVKIQKGVLKGTDRE